MKVDRVTPGSYPALSYKWFCHCFIEIINKVDAVLKLRALKASGDLKKYLALSFLEGEVQELYLGT
ncbi:MAG: hypothetical protein D3909_10765 [Candidatus Electrothrix sp. ATG1]|nr:hypothetical protein [Candidatus Electrothrix sp. ATG1]